MMTSPPSRGFPERPRLIKFNWMSSTPGVTLGSDLTSHRWPMVLGHKACTSGRRKMAFISPVSFIAYRKGMLGLLKAKSGERVLRLRESNEVPVLSVALVNSFSSADFVVSVLVAGLSAFARSSFLVLVAVTPDVFF